MQRLRALLRGEALDRVPVWLFSELVPMDLYEAHLRPRGVGLIHHAGSVRTEQGGVEIVETRFGDRRIVEMRTPLGNLTASWRTGREDLSGSGEVQCEFFVKRERDVPAMIYALEHTSFTIDADAYLRAVADMGDVITHTWCDEPPYMGLQYLLGYEAWAMHQYDHPEAFGRLMDAYGDMQERRMAAQIAAPEKDLINIGNLAGNFSPAKYREHCQPYFDRQAARLHAVGCSVTVHADAVNLRAFRDVFPGPDIDVVEAFTPPPVGDLGLAEARAAWGPGRTFHIHIPETVFLMPRDEIAAWARDLLQSDPGGRRFLSFTELGFLGTHGALRQRFLDGLLTVLDVVDETPY